MPIAIPKSAGTQEAQRKTRSLIKPHLLNLSGSGSRLRGAIIERDLEQPHVEYEPVSGDGASGQSPKHVLVLPSDAPTKLEWKINGGQKRALFTKDDAILNPAGLFTAPHWETEVEIVLFAINAALVNRIAEEMGRSDCVELIPNYQFRDQLLQQLARALIAEFEQDVPFDRVYAESLTHILITHLIKRYSVKGLNPSSAKRGLPPRTLKRITDYINDHLSGELSLEDFAEVAGYSPSYFITLFKQSTGLTPHQYVITQRIEKASALLTRTSNPIADIALQTGFADQSHLTRQMRRHIGLTPKVLRDG